MGLLDQLAALSGAEPSVFSQASPMLYFSAGSMAARRCREHAPVRYRSTVTGLARDRSRTEATPATAAAPVRFAAVGFRAACGWRAGDAKRVALLLTLDCNGVQSRLT